MTGLRFRFRATLHLHDLAFEIYHIKEPQKVPLVLNQAETMQLLTKADTLSGCRESPAMSHASHRLSSALLGSVLMSAEAQDELCRVDHIPITAKSWGKQVRSA
jgi:hypothetical protein